MKIKERTLYEFYEKNFDPRCQFAHGGLRCDRIRGHGGRHSATRTRAIKPNETPMPNVKSEPPRRGEWVKEEDLER